MNTMPALAHQSILSLTPYVGGTSCIKGVSKVYKLSSNEGAFGTNPNVVKACQDNADKLFRYPDGGSTQLRQALANAHGMDENKIVCGSGSDELIGLLCHAFLKPNDEVIVTQYAFLMYRLYATGCGAFCVTVPEKNFRIDIQAILSALTRKTKIIFIANPGNPTGTYIPKSDLIELCKKLPSSVLLVLDSAYAEFVEQTDYDAGKSIVDTYPNVVMLRTFSKIYGLGGVRLGFCYGSTEITDILNRIRSPFNVNAMAQIAGVAAVQDQDFIEKCFKHNRKWLEQLKTQIPALGLSQTDSVANFVLVHFPKTQGKTAVDADLFLQSKGILVRRVASYNLPDSLRITIGNDEEMELVLKTLKEFMGL